MYITLQQLAERPGARELAQVASTAHEAVVDDELMDLTLRGGNRSAYSGAQIAAADEAAARITEAVGKADALIDGFLHRRGYALPLTPVKPVVSEWSRQIARYFLHKDRITDERNNPIARDYRDAMKLLNQVATGQFSLGIGDTQTPVSARDVQSESATRVFDENTLADYG